ncbi:MULTISPECIES: hypothetical protein [unclassified Mycobacterium]|uniref:hypothetical protein n=1 Tax=unclassified Mycobacterium TaxID=2642494 RepID=UPI0007402E4A|nr:MULTISPECIES: hypothetical protein [unclassified Mycobacterium]KUH86471.1 hypothetical protein AU187_06890 [Mycobacterium sp. IS-1556]KUH86604.1 hypothetical protein AU185_18465 [Mycobacterium sp. GA-0227b]KUH91881.1 hypothetical protein AU186_05180 [Mycobacterium sp. GA-1999]
MTEQIFDIKKIGAVCGLSVSFVLGGFTSVAAADLVPDTGTYDDNMDLEQEECWGELSSPPTPFEVGDPESAGCQYSRTSE